MTTLRPEMVTVIQDSREQDPLDLAPMPVEVAGLASGDYVLAAAPDVAVIERKSIADLLGCIGRGRERFERELQRLRAFPCRVVLVEGHYPDLFQDARSRLSPESIVGTLAAWQARYCGFLFAGTKAAAEEDAQRFFMNVARQLYQRAEAFTKAVESQKETLNV